MVACLSLSPENCGCNQRKVWQAFFASKNQIPYWSDEVWDYEVENIVLASMSAD